MTRAIRPITIEISGSPRAGKSIFFEHFVEWLKTKGSVTHIAINPEDDTHAVTVLDKHTLNLIIKTKQTI